MDELYVLARRVLLDALEALGSHRNAAILVGAQAVYLRVGEADLGVAPYTTDGDLAIDPSALAESPPVEQSLMGAGFLPKGKESVGIWITHGSTSQNPKTEVAVDLLVPSSMNPGKGRRGAKLPGHAARAARLVLGLEGTIVDADTMSLTALEVNDRRAFDVRVAGPAGLLVAKLHKIQDRHGTARSNDKDALDVLRILRGTTTEELAGRFQHVREDTRSRDVARAAVDVLKQLFADRAGAGVQMASRAVGSLADPEEIMQSCVVLANDLLRSLQR